MDLKMVLKLLLWKKSEFKRWYVENVLENRKINGLCETHIIRMKYQANVAKFLYLNYTHYNVIYTNFASLIWDKHWNNLMEYVTESIEIHKVLITQFSI